MGARARSLGQALGVFFPHQAPPFPCACACNTGARSQRCRGAASQPPIVARTSAPKPANTLSVGKCSSGFPTSRCTPANLAAANHTSSEQQLPLLPNSMLTSVLVRQPAAGNPARKGCVALALFARTQTRPASGPPLRTHPALRGAAGKTTNQANIGVPRIITIWTRAGGSLLAVAKHNYGCLLDPARIPASLFSLVDRISVQSAQRLVGTR